MRGDEIRILSPTAILGYGFPVSSFEAGLARSPHVIAVDAGSTDPGPYYLGEGVSFTDRAAVHRDLTLILTAAHERGIPVVIGSAGGAGAAPHLRLTRDVVEQVVREARLGVRLAVVPADVPEAVLLDALADGRLRAMPPGPPATEDDVRTSRRVVAQMGVGPLVAALRQGADVVLAGRAYDPAVFAALPILRGADPGLALHLGKILECAAIAAVPGSGSDCMLGTLRADHFVVEPLAPERVCTVTSVAAHTLYEKSDPFHLPGPDGVLDLSAAEFAPDGDRAVRVRGSRFVPSASGTLKVEGAAPVGFRTVAIAGARDPAFLARVDEIVAAVRSRVADNFAGHPELGGGRYHLLVHRYGLDGVMGDLEPRRPRPGRASEQAPEHVLGYELGLVIEAVAATQALADTICGFARSTMLHLGYPGRLSTAGNLAFPYSPSDLHAGAVHRFSLYHLLDGADPAALFPIELVDLSEPSELSELSDRSDRSDRSGRGDEGSEGP